MTNTLADILNFISPDVPPSLISPEYLAHIGAVARLLPSTMTTFFGFESRLADDLPQADLLLYLTPNEGGRDILAGSVPAVRLLDSLQAHPVWQRLRRFSQTWADPTSLLSERVRDLWLEFDINDQPVSPPVPSCFFHPQLLPGETGDWMTTTAIPLLCGQALPIPVEQKILACLAELPGKAYIFQVGVMMARPSTAVRLCIRDITPADILPYLTRLGWSGPSGPLAALIANLSRQVDRVDLDLDVGEVLLPKIGLECYFDPARQPQTEPRWRLFLDFLVQSGLCHPAKRDGLLGYPGYTRQKDQPLWSDHLQITASLLDNHCESIIFRGLHHIKIVYQPDGSLEAKAYLYISRSLISQQLIKQLSTALAAA